ncbi:MAG: hypothetical protein ACK4K0_03180 [Flavobacteriales bacterium]
MKNSLFLRKIKNSTNEKINSILFNAAKTNLPMPKPIGSVTPGASNLSQASIKLIAHTIPNQIKAMAAEN